MFNMACYSTHGISQFLLNNAKKGTVFIGPPCKYIAYRASRWPAATRCSRNSCASYCWPDTNRGKMSADNHDRQQHLQEHTATVADHSRLNASKAFSYEQAPQMTIP